MNYVERSRLGFLWMESCLPGLGATNYRRFSRTNARTGRLATAECGNVCPWQARCPEVAGLLAIGDAAVIFPLLALTTQWLA